MSTHRDQLREILTAPVINVPATESRQDRYISALETLYGDRFQVIQGHYKSKTQTCRKCHATWQRNEEKETDVNIALHLLRDAMEQTYDSALIMSADSDLVPAVRMLKEIRQSQLPRKIVIGIPPRIFDRPDKWR
ncbi:NYN domain-containing protein [Kocuria sp.]|uniref:NYN domain-containing protein n=1 Tax=Kocuria sp. TaxID=1871328 RepID=UPI0026E05FC9|nr:NYN domain-containing protein [Kocuria sp.]MDO5618005.1 NYN domain-containing protein [Kocuria sp.]